MGAPHPLVRPHQLPARPAPLLQGLASTAVQAKIRSVGCVSHNSAAHLARHARLAQHGAVGNCPPSCTNWRGVMLKATKHGHGARQGA